MPSSQATERRDPITAEIIGAAIEVHRILGPGLLESTYEGCLAVELRLRGIAFERQVNVPVLYKGTQLDIGYRIDLLVARSVIVEVKSVNKIHPVMEAQVLTYLKLAGLHTALLCNFNMLLMKDGITRLVLRGEGASAA
jgi:GxxExxY protein